MSRLADATDVPASAAAADFAADRFAPRPLSAALESIDGRLRDFYDLTKPRMNFLVLVTTLVGYFMAARFRADWVRLPHTLIGTALCAAGASVLNQYVERGYDALMPRTRRRPLPAGRVAPAEAMWFGVTLAVSGVATLALFVNPLTAALGAFTILSYVGVYTPLKRVTSLNTIIGAVPGAVPPMMGVTAACGSLTADAWALFLILFVWQVPHFLAIAILYRDDYAAGGFQMLPVVDRDLVSTSRQMLLYAAALVPVSMLPTLLHMTGPLYAVAAVLLGLGFFSSTAACATSRTRADARKVFFASIIYLPLVLGAMVIAKR